MSMGQAVEKRAVVEEEILGARLRSLDFILKTTERR